MNKIYVSTNVKMQNRYSMALKIVSDQKVSYIVIREINFKGIKEDFDKFAIFVAIILGEVKKLKNLIIHSECEKAVEYYKQNVKIGKGFQVQFLWLEPNNLEMYEVHIFNGLLEASPPKKVLGRELLNISWKGFSMSRDNIKFYYENKKSFLMMLGMIVVPHQKIILQEVKKKNNTKILKQVRMEMDEVTEKVNVYIDGDKFFPKTCIRDKECLQDILQNMYEVKEIEQIHLYLNTTSEKKKQEFENFAKTTSEFSIKSLALLLKILDEEKFNDYIKRMELNKKNYRKSKKILVKKYNETGMVK